MRYLALDVGTKRIGLAYSDELGLTAQPLPPIHRTSIKKDFAEIERQIETFQIGEIIVGYPRNMDGTEGPQARYVLEFVEKLKQNFSLPVRLWDERLSTSAVERAMLEGNLSRAKRKRRVDTLAAQWILQGYLEAQRSRGKGDV